MATPLRRGSLFSGYTGTDMAVDLALGSFGLSARTIWHSDIKPAAVTLLEHRAPDVPNLGDMTAIDYSTVSPIDVLASSWPCQPHSAAGKRLGEKDPRALWPAVVRAVEATRPAIFFGENVARIASNGELRRVVRSLAHHGYVGAWRCVRASDVGACHRRDRCFVVAVDPAAYANGGPAAVALNLAESGTRTAGVGSAEPGRRDHGTGLTLLPTPCRRDVKGPGVRGPRPDGYARSDAQDDLPGVIERLNLLPSPRESDGRKGGPGMRGSSGDLMLPSAVMDFLPTPSASNYGTNRGGAAGRVGPVRESLDTMARNNRFDRWGKYAAAIARHEQVLGRPAPEPTQLSETYLKHRARRLAGQVRKPVGMRGSLAPKRQLAPRFVEWMQMLPEGWVTDVPGLTRNEKLSLLGDGVVSLQGAFAFRFLLGHLLTQLTVEHVA